MLCLWQGFSNVAKLNDFVTLAMTFDTLMEKLHIYFLGLLLWSIYHWFWYLKVILTTCMPYLKMLNLDLEHCVLYLIMFYVKCELTKYYQESCCRLHLLRIGRTLITWWKNLKPEQMRKSLRCDLGGFLFSDFLEFSRSFSFE